MGLRTFVMLGAAGAAAAACSEPFDATKDYFAGKTPFTPKYAKTFSVSFNKYYKKLSVTTPTGKTIVSLSVCGAPKPTREELGAASGDEVVQFVGPLSKAAITSTTYLTYFELMGARSKVSAIAGANYFHSPCIRQAVANGAVADVGDQWGSFDATNAAVADVEVILRGTGSWDILGTGKDVPVGETAEEHPLGVAEYMGYVASYFDLEDAARAALATVEARYECAARVASAVTAVSAANNAAQPKILMGYRYVASAGANSWYISSCAAGGPRAYYCELMEAAGASLVSPPASSANPLSDAEFALLASGADIFIYTGSDWDTTLAPLLTDAAPSDPALAALLKAVPAVTAKKVWDILGSGVDAWFERRPAEEDAVLQELVEIAHPAYTASLGSAFAAPKPGFYRNVFAEAAGLKAAASTCTGVQMSMPVQLLSSSACPNLNGMGVGAQQLVAAAPNGSGDGLTQSQRDGLIAGVVIGGCVLIAAAAFIAFKVASSKAAASLAAAKAAGVTTVASTGAAAAAPSVDSGVTLAVREPAATA